MSTPSSSGLTGFRFNPFAANGGQSRPNNIPSQPSNDNHINQQSTPDTLSDSLNNLSLNNNQNHINIQTSRNQPINQAQVETTSTGPYPRPSINPQVRPISNNQPYNQGQVPQPTQVPVELIQVTGVVGQCKANCIEIKGKDGITYQCIHNLFCPAQYGDVIAAQLRPENGVYRIVTEPYVRIGNDRRAVINSINMSLKSWKTKKGEMYFEALALKAGSDDSVGAYISDNAYKYNQSRDKIVYETLAEGIPAVSARDLLVWWYKSHSLRQLYLLGLNNTEIRDSKLSPVDIYAKCLDNPFLHLPSFNLDKCKTIVNRLLREYTETDVLHGRMIRRVYDNMVKKGWTYTPAAAMLREFPQMKDHIDFLRDKQCLSTYDDGVYIRSAHDIEQELADHLNYLITKNMGRDPNNSFEPEFERMDLSDDQRAAIRGALNFHISVITGGPGTGKTTILRELIHNIGILGENYLLCSFTGKAVSRIKEAIRSDDPMTIHRFLNGGHKKPDSDEIKRIDWIIVDEVSMVTVELLNALLWEAKVGRPNDDVPNVVLVGDINQLPPIGWGYLFQEVLRSGSIPVFRLTENHRCYAFEGPVDGIIANCYALVNSCPEWLYRVTLTENFFLYEEGMSKITEIVSTFKRIGMNPNHLTIITPYNKYLDELNKKCQAIWNGDNESVTDAKGKIWRIGDRVMMTENDYEINIMNGEEGMVIGFEDKKLTEKEIEDIKKKLNGINVNNTPLPPIKTTRKCVIVDFSKGENGKGIHSFPLDAQVKIDSPGESDHTIERTVHLLAHSFAITIHKSQGSEWDFIVVYLGEEGLQLFDKFGRPIDSSFLNWQLLMTAYSRAKRAAYCIGKRIGFETTGNRKPPIRYDNLAKRLTNNTLNQQNIDAAAYNASNIIADSDEGYNLPPDFDF